MCTQTKTGCHMHFLPILSIRVCKREQKVTFHCISIEAAAAAAAGGMFCFFRFHSPLKHRRSMIFFLPELLNAGGNGRLRKYKLHLQESWWGQERFECDKLGRRDKGHRDRVEEGG